MPGQTEWRAARLQTGHLVGSVPASDRLSLLGCFTVANGTFDADPLVDGVRIEVRGAGATPPIAITLPPGAYAAPGPGWTMGGHRRRFTFQDKRPGGTNGISKMTIVDRRSGEVQVSLLGRSGAFGFTDVDLPLQATVVFGGAAASTTGRCGVLGFGANDCRVRSAGQRIDCR
jgi:hypothetical protein